MTRQQQPPAVPFVPVRTGEHPDYTRLVFDWPAKTQYRVTGGGQDHTISFNQNGNIKLGPLQRYLPRWVSSIEQQAGDGSTEVKLATSAPTKINSFLSGNSVVIDISKDDNASASQPAEVKPEPVQKPSTPVKKLTDNVPTLTAVNDAEGKVSGEEVAGAEGLRPDEKTIEPAVLEVADCD